MAEPVAGPEVMSPLGVGGVLARARVGAGRCTPQEVVAATRRGSLLVDTRTETQRHEQGELPGALVIDRTVLEWRLDPASAYRIPEATGYDVEIVVVCAQDYSSSIAAASLRALGLFRAVDLIGGVEAWKAAGLSCHGGPTTESRECSRWLRRRLGPPAPTGVFQCGRLSFWFPYRYI